MFFYRKNFYKIVDTLNLQELTFEEQVNTEGGWLGTVGIVVGIQ